MITSITTISTAVTASMFPPRMSEAIMVADTRNAMLAISTIIDTYWALTLLPVQ